VAPVQNNRPKVERLNSGLKLILSACLSLPDNSGVLFRLLCMRWFRIPFSRFATVSILPERLLSIVLTVVILFGDLVLNILATAWVWRSVIIGFAVRIHLNHAGAKQLRAMATFLFILCVFKKIYADLDTDFTDAFTRLLKKTVRKAEKYRILFSTSVGLYYCILVALPKLYSASASIPK